MAIKAFYYSIIFGIFIFFSCLRTAQAGSPAASQMDLVAPEILAIKVPDKVYAGSEVKIQATVSDNEGLKSVALFFRPKGGEQYTKQEMTRGLKKDEYIAVLKNVSSAGVEYYIQATDLGGNLVRNGQKFSPHYINVLGELDMAVIENMKPGRLDNKDILTLFNNKTVDGYHVRKKFAFTRYFASDGKLIGISKQNGKRTGRWRVAEKMLCEQFDKQQETCREIVKEGKSIKKYTTTRNGDTVIAIIYKRFRYGNPDNL